MAHHNSLGICHQLKIRHLYGTFNFSIQCIYMGTGSLFVYRFSSFSWKMVAKTVASIAKVLEPHLRVHRDSGGTCTMCSQEVTS